MGEFKKRTFGRSKFGGKPVRDSSRPVELHQATCSQCQKVCEVPFRPNGKKPVLCRDCFGASKPQGFERTERHTPRFERKESYAPRPDAVTAQLAELNAKIDALTRMVKALSN